MEVKKFFSVFFFSGMEHAIEIGVGEWLSWFDDELANKRASISLYLIHSYCEMRDATTNRLFFPKKMREKKFKLRKSNSLPQRSNIHEIIYAFFSTDLPLNGKYIVHDTPSTVY